MKTERGGRRRKRSRDGIGTTILSASGDTAQEAAHAIATESAAIDIETARDRATGAVATTTETISAGTDREVATTSGGKSALTIEESEALPTNGRGRAQGTKGAGGTQEAGHRTRDLREGGTEEHNGSKATTASTFCRIY
jgi:hypothetical protein